MAQRTWFIPGLIVAAALALAQPALAKTKATNYIYSLDSWHVTTTHGEDLDNGLYHMGIDAGGELGAGAPVYAAAVGIVREAQERTQFGLVVLIDHVLPDGTANVSVYGHLDPTDVRVTPGQTVAAGDIIGVLGTQANNGGWTPHLHFGIHKEAYTGGWVYYGHVHDPATATDWEDPETFIPQHLVQDDWAPTVTLDINAGDLVGETADFSVTARDIGSRVKTIFYKISSDDGATWETLERTRRPYGDVIVQLPLLAYADGPLQLQVVAKDHFQNKTAVAVAIVKDSYRYTLPAFVAMRAGQSNATMTQWSFGGHVLQTIVPFHSTWAHGGDLALGDVLGLGGPQIVAVRGTAKKPAKIKIFDAAGAVQNHFTVAGYSAVRIGTGDVTGDGQADIILGSGPNDPATVLALTSSGEAIWSAQPMGADTRGGFDVAAGNLDDDVALEVVAVTLAGPMTEIFLFDDDGAVLNQFYPFRQSFTGGADSALGDVTGDGQNEVIVASAGGMPGTVKVLNNQGKPLLTSFRPFGDDFTGSIDAAMMQWDTTEDNIAEQELLVSQASAGQAWIKVYRLSADPEILLTKLIDDSTWLDGALVAGYQY